MKISIKELQEIVRKELTEASGRRRKPPAWSGASGPAIVPISPETEYDAPPASSDIRSYASVGKHEMRPADQGQRLGQTYLGPELDEISPEEQAIIDANIKITKMTADPSGFYSKLSEVALTYEDDLTGMQRQGHRNAEKFNVDEILLIVKQLNKAIEKVKLKEKR